jgi:hypothetical protein
MVDDFFGSRQTYMRLASSRSADDDHLSRDIDLLAYRGKGFFGRHGR